VVFATGDSQQRVRELLTGYSVTLFGPLSPLWLTPAGNSGTFSFGYQ